LLNDGGTLAQALADMDSQIKSLIGSSDTIMATYASQNQAISQILDDLDQLGGQLGGMTGDIDSLITNFADVEQQLHQLLVKNKGNIDVSLAELDSVAGTLARNRANLAETLCTLPAGVAGYFQTTSWGEWFNVRIIGVTLKDSNDNPIAQVNEAPIEHGPAVAPYTCGVALSSGEGKGHGAQGSNEATNPEALQETSQAFGSLSAFVNFVLGGKHG
ncbi:MAG TPA: MCE family protein, partial [Actinomycetota bacterium]